MSIRNFAPTTASIVFMLWLAMAGVAPASVTYTNLASFDKTNGYEPTHTALIQATDGNLYGVTSYGGANDEGVVFRITPSGTLTVIYSFCSLASCADGANPYSSLFLGSNGDLYGTTYYGGANNNGTLFKITTSGTLTTLYSFCSLASCADGTGPEGQLAEDSAGNIYGTANYGGASNVGTVFKFSTKGVLTTLHSFSGADGDYPAGGLIASGGVFYGTVEYGGANGDGTVFKITTAGVETTLHSFAGTDGDDPGGWLVAAGGDFYGTTGGGANGEGTVFKMTASGTVTTLYSFCSLANCADGSQATAGLMQATDGNLYGVTYGGGANGHGTAYELTLKGVLTTLYSFCSLASCEDGDGPQGGLVQDTNGDFYGMTGYGGSSGDGVIFSIANGLKAFVTLQSTSGDVGSKVGILGDGFESSSVVKFNGTQATTVTLTEPGLLTATVPAGATDGYVTVTTGSTTLTSTQTYTVHNSWASGAAMPTARFGAFTGAVGANVYVIGGGTNSSYAVTGVNEIYNTTTNKWTTGAADPTPRELGASAVVNGILYVIGGTPGGSGPLNLVEAYDPASNTWTTKSSMPVAMNSMPAVVDGDTIYVIGGYDPNTQTWYDTVQAYDTTTDTWTTEQPLPAATSWEAVGLLGTTIVAADGQTNNGQPTGDTEGYNPTTNTWTTFTADATPRWETCFAAISGQLYVAGGGNATEVLSVNESYNATSKKWTTLDVVPNALLLPGSATAGGQLYCFGGANSNLSSVYNYVQIYQP
jgi:uncharacterized repeat protein (TIGR03803 family)